MKKIIILLFVFGLSTQAQIKVPVYSLKAYNFSKNFIPLNFSLKQNTQNFYMVNQLEDKNKFFTYSLKNNFNPNGAPDFKSAVFIGVLQSLFSFKIK